MEVRFQVLPVREMPPAGSIGPAVYLTKDLWNDYSYRTQFWATYVDPGGRQTELGAVKIARLGMGESPATTELPEMFEGLDETHFSVADDDEYYRLLLSLPPEIRVQILEGLRDMAWAPSIFAQARLEEVTVVSLLRELSAANVQGHLHRLIHEMPPLTQFAMSYLLPDGENLLTFEVLPDSNPPSNIHVLIGRNGVGKTYLLGGMARSLLGATANAGRGVEFDGRFETPDDISNVVSVSFSAFDSFLVLGEEATSRSQIKYTYVGLKQSNGPTVGTMSDPEQLGSDFASSLRSCLGDSRRGRWRRAITTLNADPNFRDANLLWLSDSPWRTEEDFYQQATEVFRSLSSGHSIVLLMLTRLVEKVSEKTLVLLDEPESHLHPPLLSAFVRALSDLLRDRNGLAIVATHSPVVLQEVPASCVWTIVRSGEVWNTVRPTVETFGENVGVLTHEAFGLEVQESGFYRMLKEAVEEFGSVEAVKEQFGGRLGAEAEALVRTYLLLRRRKPE